MATSGAATNKRRAKTAAEIKADIEAAKKRLAAAEAKEYSGAVKDMIEKLSFKSDFAQIKAAHAGASDVLILELIGAALGIKRLVITQTLPKPRPKKAK